MINITLAGYRTNADQTDQIDQIDQHLDHVEPNLPLMRCYAGCVYYR